jgi:LmbE family N-acetylglucosaminyl deacetylase
MRYTGTDAQQKDQGRRAAEILGMASFEPLDFPDQHLDTISLVEIIRSIEERIRRIRPQIVYTHFDADVNRDHRLVHEATVVACRPVEGYIEEMYSFETPSATEWNVPLSFSPDYFVDISATLEDKLRAFACYESEVREYPHPRSLKSLEHRAHYWGNVVGMNAAEPFVTLRRLWR